MDLLVIVRLEEPDSCDRSVDGCADRSVHLIVRIRRADSILPRLVRPVQEPELASDEA